ncbi:NUDIX hydrolase [Pseudaestuariivita atlantica]|uniref:NUDIX hydrolase n=1 Tax=Pseudaestuariivita atlantica TaxID=1317121 RepID=A0A0L1JSW1_9RHOB|nr:NUDIX hydrolase [Pseudaestuariivita atlantica]KNG94840.1 NUDIX hydrolase [Pseudaestuariivita atlantica]
MKQLPLTLRAAHKSDIRTQICALCYRVEQGKTRVLLVTSRQTRRWILPKGWPIDGLTPAQTAATEAWEEAGVRGKAMDQRIGLISYLKDSDSPNELPCIGLVYPVKVKKIASIFPERKERQRKWLSPKKAAARVNAPDLAALLRSFDPARLR